jgi:hypothetical protein
VVYIMVELRKLIELNRDGANYPAHKLHCDWVAHPLLQGPAAQEIVRLFDQYQKWLSLPCSSTTVLARSRVAFSKLPRDGQETQDSIGMPSVSNHARSVRMWGCVAAPYSW